MSLTDPHMVSVDFVVFYRAIENKIIISLFSILVLLNMSVETYIIIRFDILRFFKAFKEFIN